MSQRRKVRWAAALTLSLLVVTACGTRLPNSAFQLAQTSGSGNTVTPGQPGSAGSGGTGATGTDQGANGTTSSGTGATGTNGVTGTGSSGSAGSTGATATGVTTPGGGGTSGSAASGPNTASDVGVTPTSILIGNVTGITGPLGPDAFGPTLNGLKVFVSAINARGGINGRKLILDACDDGQDGARNLACAQKLVAHDNIFAFLDNNSLATAPSAHYEFQQGVPDLGLPLNNGYYKYPNMFTLYGSSYPRDGTQVGDKGLNWATTGVYRFFRQKVGVTKAAFFFYSETASLSAARSQEQQSAAEGIQNVYESGGHSGENLAAPNFDADVLAMKSKNVDAVFDAIDISGNQKVCASMDRYGVKVKAKVSTIEVWSQDVGSAAWSSPCRNSIYLDSQSVPYQDTQVPAVKQFRDDFGLYGRGDTLHQWSLEGYAAGYIFADGIASMGSHPTRKGLIAWMNGIAPGSYNDHGLMTAAELYWQPHSHPFANNDCKSEVQWQDSAGTYVTRSGPNEFTCYVTNEISSPYADDGS